jgi:prepilin-type N-terminal cleavage/methylation domain-containing protein
MGWHEHGSGDRQGFLNMKPAAQHSRRGLTLVEALIVIAVVAILVVLLLPYVASIDGHAPRPRAQLEAAQIAQAIKIYQLEYGRFPVSSNAMSATASSGQDFTFGTYGLQTHLRQFENLTI